MSRVRVTHYTDPGCPWAWSASPAIAALMWRYGDQLDWRHVMIGLTESGEEYERRGYTPLRQASGFVAFRRFGMPFAPSPKAHVAGTARACRAIVAVRLHAPDRAWAALRALQRLQFTTTDLLDDDDAILRALQAVPGIDAEAAVAALDGPTVTDAYEADRALARSAAGTPAQAQGKTATSDGPVRFTAPSITFSQDDRTLVAGGFQSQMAYDVLLANLDPGLERRGPPENLLEVIRAFPDGLTTQEVAEVVARGAAREADRPAAEKALLELAATGSVAREPLGDDARWLPRA